MGIKNNRLANIKELTSSVSGSNARLITSNNIKLLSAAVSDIIDRLQIDESSDPSVVSVTASGLITANQFQNTDASWTLNNLGQMFAQGGIYTPLAHISRLRLDPDPTSAAIQAGEFRWSGSDFLGWNGTEWLSFTAGNDGPGVTTLKLIEVTYDELIDLMQASELVPGCYYLITNYRTIHYIQYSGTTMYVDEEINVGDVEPIIVQASGVNQIHAQAVSTLWPQDMIVYTPFASDYQYDMVDNGTYTSPGAIVRRKDMLANIQRDYDWRAFIFRRWETAPGTGKYHSITPVPGSAFQDMQPQTSIAPTSPLYPQNSNIVIYSNRTAALPFDAPAFDYYADNTVIEGEVDGLTISAAFGNHFAANCYMNIFGVLAGCTFENTVLGNNIMSCANVNFTGEVYSNSILLITDSSIDGMFAGNDVLAIEQVTLTGGGQMTCNTGFYIDNTSAASIKGNNFKSITNTTVTTEIHNNVTVEIENNTANYISGNCVNRLSNNVITGNLNDNTGAEISDNSIGGNISFNTIGIINNCTISGNVEHNTGNVLGYAMSDYSLVGTRFNVVQNVSIMGDIQNHDFMTTHQDASITPTAEMSNDDVPTMSAWHRTGGMNLEGYYEMYYSDCTLNCTSISTPIVGPTLHIVFASIHVEYENIVDQIELQSSPDGVDWTTIETSTLTDGQIAAGSGTWNTSTEPVDGTWYRAITTNILGNKVGDKVGDESAEQYMTPVAQNLTIESIGTDTINISYSGIYGDISVKRWFGSPGTAYEIYNTAWRQPFTPDEFPVTGNMTLGPEIPLLNNYHYYVEAAAGESVDDGLIQSDSVLYEGASINIIGYTDNNNRTKDYTVDIAEADSNLHSIEYTLDDIDSAAPRWKSLMSPNSGGNGQIIISNITSPFKPDVSGSITITVRAKLEREILTYYSEPVSISCTDPLQLTMAADVWTARYTTVYGDMTLQYAMTHDGSWNDTSDIKTLGSYPESDNGTPYSSGYATPGLPTVGYFYRLRSLDSSGAPLYSNVVHYPYSAPVIEETDSLIISWADTGTVQWTYTVYKDDGSDDIASQGDTASTSIDLTSLGLEVGEYYVTVRNIGELIESNIVYFSLTP